MSFMKPEFAVLKEPAVKILGSGVQSVAIELANGGVFKLTLSAWKPEWGTRPFDAKLLSPVTQVPGASPGEKVSLYLQEPVTKIPFWKYAMFKPGREFVFDDPKAAQLGRALRSDGERTVVIDYGSVIGRHERSPF